MKNPSLIDLPISLYLSLANALGGKYKKNSSKMAFKMVSTCCYCRESQICQWYPLMISMSSNSVLNPLILSIHLQILQTNL